MSVSEQPEIHSVNLNFVKKLCDPLGQATEGELHSFISGVFPRELWLGQAALTSTLAREILIAFPSTNIEELIGQASVVCDKAAEITLESLQDLEALTNHQVEVGIEIASKKALPDKLGLAAADYFTRRAHAGERRLTGKPYTSHTLGVAAIVMHLFDQQDKSQNPDIQLKEASMIVAATHDMTEKTSRLGRFFNKDLPGHHSPLLIDRLMKHPQVENPYANSAADAIWRITHLKDLDWMPTYRDYILQGCQGNEKNSLLFTLVKLVDIHWNSIIEPKPIPNVLGINNAGEYTEHPDTHKQAAWARKLQDYDMANLILEANARRLAGAMEDGAWLENWQPVLKDLDLARITQLSARRNDYIYGAQS